MRTLSSLAIFGALGLTGACGDDGTTSTDAGSLPESGVMPDSGTPGIDSGVPGTDSGSGPAGMHCEGDDVLIAEVVPGTSVTVFNPTAAEITVSADLSMYQFCSQPAYTPLDSTATIPAGGSHTFELPAFFDDTDADGELAIYSNGGFTNPDSIVDFVCWGPARTEALGRKDEAEAGGHWSGDCVGAITGGSLRRIPDTDGTSASSYDPTGAALALGCP